MHKIPATLILLPFLLPFVLAAACGGPPPEFGPSRRVAKDERPTVWDAPTKERLGVSDMMGADQNTEWRYSGTTPEGWEEKEPQPRRFKNLIWSIKDAPDAECWLTASVGGGAVGNMGRWYGQFGMTPAAPESLPEATFAGEPARLLELSGTYDGKPDTTSIIVFKATGQQVASIKLVASVAVAKVNRDKFLTLAATLQKNAVAQGASSGSSGMKPGPVDPNGPNPHGANPPSGSPPGGELTQPFTATAPSSWQRDEQSSRALHHTFGTDSEVYVSQLSGEIEPMLGIWRGEVGIKEPLTKAEFEALSSCEMLGADAYWLDASGDFTSMSGKQIRNARIIVVVRNDSGTITFVKLVGPAAEVEAELDAFRAFCASIRRNS